MMWESSRAYRVMADDTPPDRPLAGILRLGAAFSKLSTPSPSAEFVPLIKPLPFAPRQGG
jgi:hypothetical protein